MKHNFIKITKPLPYLQLRIVDIKHKSQEITLIKLIFHQFPTPRKMKSKKRKESDIKKREKIVYIYIYKHHPLRDDAYIYTHEKIISIHL